MEATSLPEANAIIARMGARIAELERQIAWADGRRADGKRRAGNNAIDFTESETRLLRILASSGEIAHNRFDAQQRHMSNIRKRIREAGLDGQIIIKTRVMDGYKVIAGMAALKRLCAGESKIKAFSLPKESKALEAAA